MALSSAVGDVPGPSGDWGDDVDGAMGVRRMSDARLFRESDGTPRQGTPTDAYREQAGVADFLRNRNDFASGIYPGSKRRRPDIMKVALI